MGGSGGLQWQTDLGLGVVLGLLGATDHGPPLVGIEQVGDVVADDAGRAGVDEGLDAGVLAGLDDGLRALDVDLLEDVMGDLGVVGDGRGGVDDDVGLDLVEDGEQLLGVGDVALVVLGVRVAVAPATQVDGDDARGGPRLDELVDDVVAQEAVAADDEHLAQRASGFGHCGGLCGGGGGVGRAGSRRRAGG